MNSFDGNDWALLCTYMYYYMIECNDKIKWVYQLVKQDSENATFWKGTEMSISLLVCFLVRRWFGSRGEVGPDWAQSWLGWAWFLQLSQKQRNVILHHPSPTCILHSV